MTNTNRRNMSQRILTTQVAATVILLLVTAAPIRGEEPPDFQQVIRPILVEHCFQCHGPDKGAREAGLRFDIRDVALAARKSGKIAIVPGDPAASELLRRVTSKDPALVMPPAEEQNPLTPEQITALQRWVSEGAIYTEHWAFTTPRRPKVPPLKAAGDAVRNPIDHFVAAQLEKKRLALAPGAPHDILCRRIFLDLIGLPPTPEQVSEFVAAAHNDLPKAVEALAHRLLRSEHFGEKWARHWLDVARYADSNGYEKDLAREQWAWRDWVIQSINRDMPYDQFLVEQIAGDLLPDRTQDHLVATGFLRNGMINEEGAIIPEEFRLESMFDRMDTIGKSILGLSIQCGQCHSHKYDPLTQDEYYGMLAFLNNTYEAQSAVYTKTQQREIAAVRTGIASVDKRLKSENPDWRQRLATWEKTELQQRQKEKWQILEAVDLHSSTELNHPTMLPDKSVLVLGHRTTRGDNYVIAEPDLTATTGIRIEMLTSDDLPLGGPGRSYKGTWALTELIVESQRPGSEEWERLKLTNASADFAEPEHSMEEEWKNKNLDKEDKRVCGPAAFLADGNDETGWRADRGPGRRNQASVAVAQFEQPLDLPQGTRLKISLRGNHGGSGSGDKCTMVGRFRLALTTSPDPKVNATPHAAVLAMQTLPEQRTPEQQSEIFAAWRESVPEFMTFNAAIDALWQQFPEPHTSILHLAKRRHEDTRETFLLDRGVWNQPKSRVKPHVPAFLHAMREDAPVTRTGFAEWLADERSPLTARVQVNRVWQAIFGNGIVDTPEDFGTRAPQPAHRELLDWLAVDFMEGGWSLKKLVRTIVSSATYQQSSRITPALLQRDPQNRLLARGPRFRAEAEIVRDIALSVSGLLYPAVGGPSVFPPVPQNVLDINFVKPDYWIPPEGPKRYRRAIYIFRKRSMPDPVLTSFDAPNADFSCARRVRSNTPLSALVSLNEPTFVESARALALRILREGGATDSERVDYAYQLCTSRGAKPAERAEVLALLENRRRRLAEGWLSINEVATGDSAKTPELPPKTTPQDAAAWTIAARVLLNLDETLSKN